MKLRSGKVIGHTAQAFGHPTTPIGNKAPQICPQAPKKPRSHTPTPTPANSPMLPPLSIPPNSGAPAVLIGISSGLKPISLFGVPYPVYVDYKTGFTPFNPSSTSNNPSKCPCGKMCDLTIGKCCHCADERPKQKNGKVWRGHGIYYSNDTFGYCPKCRTAKTEIHHDKVHQGFFH